jgi:hypothetical protein
MVHNGIEYGIMAAYAEGVSILRSANIGKRGHIVDAETAPLRDPEHYQHDFNLPDVAEVWRRGSVVASWLLDLSAAALIKDPELKGFHGRGLGVVCFRHEVQLVLDRLHELADDLLGPIGGQLGDVSFRQRREMGQQVRVGFDGGADPRALNLEHDLGAVLQRRAVNLRHGCGGEGRGVDVRKDLVERASEIFFDLRTQRFEVQGRRLGLEFFELGDPLGSKQVRPGGENLPELDERRPQDLEDAAHALRTSKVRNLVCMLPAEDMAGPFNGGFEPHLLEQVAKAGNGEHRGDLLQSSEVGELQRERHA